MSTNVIGDLVRRAELAERAGARAEAQAAWAALVAADPNHPRALFAVGRQRVESGDPAGGLAVLSRAEAADRTHAETPFFAALAHRLLDQYPQALAAIDRALAIDAYFFMALLSKGVLLEKLGHRKSAAQTFRNAIKIAPPPERLPPSQRAALDHAKAVVAQYSEDLAQHLRKATASLRERYRSERLDRFEESIDILAGAKPRQVHDPILFYFPRLPAIPFYDRELFPWLSTLEAATDMIRDELNVVMREERGKFAPYIQMPPGAPVNQWRELNHSQLWSTLHLWRDGAREEEVCARCPKTAALLSELPLAHQAGFSPNVVFSVLSPNTRIPPHTGSTNARLILHLPLILPPKCGFRVGNESREWRMGEAWVFDDSIDHEAWNDSSEPRVILIFDVWNPLLTEAERALVTETLQALKQFNADE